MTVQELLDALAHADPSWDVELEYEDYSGWEVRRRFEERSLLSVTVGANEHEGVTLSTQPEGR